MKQVKKIINISIRENILDEIKKDSTYSGNLSEHIKELLYEGLESSQKKDMYINLNEYNNAYRTGEKKYVTIRVPEDIYDKLREISNISGVSLPRLAGHFIEKGLKRKGEQ